MIVSSKFCVETTYHWVHKVMYMLSHLNIQELQTALASTISLQISYELPSFGMFLSFCPFGWTRRW